MKSYDVLVCGEYCFDQIYVGLSEFPELGREVFAGSLVSAGGAMFITATALRRLGAGVGWLTHFGADDYSAFVRKLALSEGLDLSLVRELERPYRQVTTAIPLAGERAFLSYSDPAPEDLYDYWLRRMEGCSFSHVHIAGLPPLPQMRRLHGAARARGASLSLDGGDHPLLRDPAFCCEILSLVDIFLPNAREALLLTGHQNARSALESLAAQTSKVVIKDGSEGAWCSDGKGSFRVPALEVSPVLDTTGAGDCFTAGFLYGYIVEQAPLERCVQYGNICGGLSITGVGGASAAPRYDVLSKTLAEGGLEPVYA